MYFMRIFGIYKWYVSVAIGNIFLQCKLNHAENRDHRTLISN